MKSVHNLKTVPTGPRPSGGIEVDPALAPPRLSFDGATLIKTAHGVQRIDALRRGDQVLTCNGQYSTIRKIESTHFSRDALHSLHSATPVRFDPGAIAGMSDDVALLLSPDCPIALSADADCDSAPFYPARAFCNGGTVRRVIPHEGITYIRLHFARPRQVCVNGVWVYLDSNPLRAVPANANLAEPAQIDGPRVFRPLR